MNFWPDPRPGNFSHITLVITPYNINGPSTWNYPELLLTSLRDIVSQYSTSGTPYQSAFYQDLKTPSRFYHFQTSLPEPLAGWPTSSTTFFTDHISSSLRTPTTTLAHDPITRKTQQSLADGLLDLRTYATPQSSDGLVRLGLNLNTVPYDRSATLAPGTTTVPFNAPLILIGTHNIDRTPDARAKFEAEMRDRLRFFRRWTGEFEIAAGWRVKGYYAADSDPDSNPDGNGNGGSGDGGAKEQFITLSGWNTMEEHTAFRSLMVKAAEQDKPVSRVLSAGRVSPDVAGETEIWGRRIA